MGSVSQHAEAWRSAPDLFAHPVVPSYHGSGKVAAWRAGKSRVKFACDRTNVGRADGCSVNGNQCLAGTGLRDGISSMRNIEVEPYSWNRSACIAGPLLIESMARFKRGARPPKGGLHTYRLPNLHEVVVWIHQVAANLRAAVHGFRSGSARRYLYTAHRCCSNISKRSVMVSAFWSGIVNSFDVVIRTCSRPRPRRSSGYVAHWIAGGMGPRRTRRSRPVCRSAD